MYQSIYNLRKQQIIGETAYENIKVSAKSNPNSVAGVVREKGRAEIQAIGPGALVMCVPAFTDIEIEGEERTAIKLTVEPG